MSEIEPVQQYWDQCLERMRGATAFVTTATEQKWDDPGVEVADYLLQTLASAYILVSRGDPDYPEFMPWLNPVFTYAAGNPDATYYFTVIDGRGTYRIVGQRNTVNWIDFLTGYDYWGFADVPGTSNPSKQMDDFYVEPDGSFEIVLSNVRPDGHSGNWMKIETNVNYIVVRQFANHPDEVDARMAIERVDHSGTPPLYSSEAMHRRVDETIRHLKNSSKAWPSFPRRIQRAENFRFNHIAPVGYGGTGEVWGQAYYQGLYHIELDEALIVEFKVPEPCRYWNLQLSDLWWRTLEAVRRQGHLNGYKNRADGDGVTRLVIAHCDPGVENWVDPGGIIEGDLVMRFLYIDAKPEVSTRIVRLNELEQTLPADTKHVTPAERETALRERRLKKQLRRSW
jgi:hypothetical protein